MEGIGLLLRYLKNLGIARGFVVYLQVEVLGMARVRMPGYSQAISLRKSTSDIKVFREVFLFGTYGIRKDHDFRIIVDAGANIGLSTVFFRKRYPAARILAIEPESSNVATLRQNIQSYSDVMVVNGALWHRDTFLKVVNEHESKWAFQVTESSGPGSFPGISIERLMRDHDIRNIDLLKLDIEGSEKELFSENYEHWLSRTRVIVIELHDWMKPGCSTSVFKALSKFQIKVDIHEGMLVIENQNLVVD